MIVLHYVAWFFGGLFLGNAVPHWVSGVQGRPFQSPFAKPPGEGLSSSRVNVLWGALNAAIAYLLLAKVGQLDVGNLVQVAAPFAGVLLISLFCAHHFGRFHGGNV